MGPYSFGAVDAVCLTATKQHWLDYANGNSENVNLPFYEGCFAACEAHLENKVAGDSTMALYGVFDATNGHKTAVALVTLVHARPKSDNAWLKMTSIYVEPMLDVANNEPDIKRLAWIAAVTIVGAIGLTFKGMPARELKIWANVPMTREFLTAVSTALFDDAFELMTHGNWLVVRKN